MSLNRGRRCSTVRRALCRPPHWLKEPARYGEWPCGMCGLEPVIYSSSGALFRSSRCTISVFDQCNIFLKYIKTVPLSDFSHLSHTVNSGFHFLFQSHGWFFHLSPQLSWALNTDSCYATRSYAESLLQQSSGGVGLTCCSASLV